MQTPTLTDELKRKSIEAIDWITQQAAKGRINEHALSVAADAVWMTASGLTGSTLLEPMDVINDATMEVDCRITVPLIDDDNRLAIVSSLPEDDFVLVQVSERKGRKVPVTDANRKEVFDLAVSKLEQIGFRRL